VKRFRKLDPHGPVRRGPFSKPHISSGERRYTGVVRFALALVLVVACAGQEKPNDAPVVSVCEVLANVDRYADTDVSIVGRMERSVSFVDHSEFLSQDRCWHPLVTHGHTFPNRILILTEWEKGMPKPPGNSPTFARTRIAAKLSEVRRTTELGSHEEPQFNSAGKLTTKLVPNEWALVYGRLVRTPRLNEDCGVGGCGGDDVPLVIIAKEREVHVLSGSGAPSRK
jgi:hypothetical protein